MHCRISLVFGLFAVAGAQTIMDTIHELEAREQESLKTEDSPVPKFNRFYAKNSAARTLNAADAAGHAQVEAEEAAKTDAYGHPVSDTMESVSSRMYANEMMKKSGAEADEWSSSHSDQEQKSCLAQCMGHFHGSLRTCAKKCH
eukprot:gnl/MRDRNA2_/MRDRNA2_142823_c0_seq1.p1 gnl/MRDRNA2_/MRDRNA2_142823_c0~~gnl/MRDRNA2_/MRDRNA2_142823_c0_seq1.p1  ORF type:complete len:144 (+),score=37.89 gnl/MRDRNA2_/MRDRNA2_142823_c0_seq1:96-527(+)